MILEFHDVGPNRNPIILDSDDIKDWGKGPVAGSFIITGDGYVIFVNEDFNEVDEMIKQAKQGEQSCR